MSVDQRHLSLHCVGVRSSFRWIGCTYSYMQSLFYKNVMRWRIDWSRANIYSKRKVMQFCETCTHGNFVHAKLRESLLIETEYKTRDLMKKKKKRQR